MTFAILRWSIMSPYLSPQFKYTIFNIFTGFLHHLRIYYELTIKCAVGLIVQLAEHCTGIAEVAWVQIPFRPVFFSGLKYRNCLSCVYKCDDQYSVSSFFFVSSSNSLVLKAKAVYRVRGKCERAISVANKCKK